MIANSHTIKELLEKVKKLEINQSGQLKHSCNQCGKTFVSYVNLNKHITKYHNIEMLRDHGTNNDHDNSLAQLVYTTAAGQTCKMSKSLHRQNF